MTNSTYPRIAARNGVEYLLVEDDLLVRLDLVVSVRTLPSKNEKKAEEGARYLQLVLTHPQEDMSIFWPRSTGNESAEKAKTMARTICALLEEEDTTCADSPE